MKIDDQYRVKIENLDHYGRGICRIDNTVVFISNALPSEIVDIKISEIKKKYALADVVNFIETSDKRVKPICKYFDKCGGCDLMHCNFDEQLNFKYNKVKEIIEKFTNIDSSFVKPIIKTNEYNYRNKIILHVSNNKLGFYEKKSNKVINIDKCYLADDRINDMITILNKLDLTNIKEIMIRKSLNTEDLMIVFDCIKPVTNNKQFETIFSKCNSVFIKYGNDYKLIYGNKTINEYIGKYKYQISPASFFQVNTMGCEMLYDLIFEYVNKYDIKNILDLYCGTGTIGIYLSSISKNITGIEINEDAVLNARENAKINEIDNAKFICSDASLVQNKVKEFYDLVIVDPPRSGLDKRTVDFLINNKSNLIVYVSCDPNTLARDLNTLNDYYCVLEIVPVDMFPNTYHIETICILERR